MATESIPDIPTYFTPGAFELARREGEAIEYDPDHLLGVTALATEVLHKPRLDLSSTAFVFRYAVPGHETPERDPSFHKANPADRIFIPADQLALPVAQEVDPIAKAEITARVARVHQIDVQDFQSPLVRWFAHSLAYPPADELQIRASAGAWLRQAREAVDPRISEAKKRQYQERVVAQFAGAIILRPRPVSANA
jgi:hypothetical protein